MNKVLTKLKKNKRKIIILSIFLMILFIPVFTIYNLTNPTKINKFITTKIYKEPANNAFVDQVFYNAVVDAYNKQNKTSLPYTTNLTDEQLATITELSYLGYNRDKITGAVIVAIGLGSFYILKIKNKISE